MATAGAGHPGGTVGAGQLAMSPRPPVGESRDVVSTMAKGTLDLDGALRPRLQLSLGAVAVLGDEIAGVAGRRRFAAHERETRRRIIVTLHAPSPSGPALPALQRRLDVLRELGHATLDLPLACGEVDGCAWVAELAPSVPTLSDRLAGGPLPLHQAVSMIRDVTRALVAMHRRDICHGAIELDAIPPDDLRRMVRQVTENYLPADQLEILKVAEDSERTLIRELVAGIGGRP